ncbi:hypothetical protein CR162_21020 [Pseudoroseomonas rhizosphaerae]|uniref:Uncharacterized protein n=2 Tax=Roseomonas TaxID=125216 RepID=A0A2C7A7F6_9PROT|nr:MULTISPECIES: hypothetical protein [Pseudoroseomonas]PHK92976.1 hypothetical protein CR162_21020 [Pseudoroseomonas rhizosphaerae]PWC26790.1 hypothetical protein CR165_21205 [Pseudoroseomonas aestuarii]
MKSAPVTCRSAGWYCLQLGVEKARKDFPGQIGAPDPAKVEAVCLDEAAGEARTLHDLDIALDVIHIAQMGTLGMDQARFHINAVDMEDAITEAMNK